MGCVLRVVRPLTDVVAAVRALPDKQCMSDPLLTHLLEDSVDLLASLLIEFFSRSLVLGVVPLSLKWPTSYHS
jgi:hypothetical protein